MSDRPTPETDFVYLRENDDQANYENMRARCKRIERQRDAYAYTLRVILKFAGQHVSDAIRHTHPELAGNAEPIDRPS